MHLCTWPYRQEYVCVDKCPRLIKTLANNDKVTVDINSQRVILENTFAVSTAVKIVKKCLAVDAFEQLYTAIPPRPRGHVIVCVSFKIQACRSVR